MIPFATEVRVSAHQIPFKPKALLPSATAKGIRVAVIVMLMILQSFVFPRPESAPMVTISTHIKASLNPIITR